MLIRSVRKSDIPGIIGVRNSVKENMLTDPSAMTEDECKQFIEERGKGWVCVQGEQIAGFGFVDMQKNNIWAFYAGPGSEDYGCSSKLHEILLDWYFALKKDPLWIGTEAGSQDEKFYQNKGWLRTGIMDNGNIRFEMNPDTWKEIRQTKEAE